MKAVSAMLAVCLFYACTKKEDTLPFFNTPDFTPEWISKSDDAYTHIHTVPAFNFIDQEGKHIQQSNVSNKIYVADFFFTKCTGICPKMTNNMSKVSDAFAADKDVMILSHSVTPEKDTVSVLKNYAMAKNITNPNWHLLTGEKTEIYSIARNGYFADRRTGYNKDTSEFLHTENFILVDKQRRIRGIYNGTIELEVEQLIKHIRLLKEE
jgi:protein SCO1/2